MKLTEHFQSGIDYVAISRVAVISSHLTVTHVLSLIDSVPLYIYVFVTSLN